MERPLTLKPLNIQDENAAIRGKKAPIDGKSKSSKPVSKKGGAALENRKALNDITNKTFVSLEASSKKKSSQKKKCDDVEDEYVYHVLKTEAPSQKSTMNEKLNIAEEGFMHDHRNCIEAQMAGEELNFLDTVLPGHGKQECFPPPSPRFLALAEVKYEKNHEFFFLFNCADKAESRIKKDERDLDISSLCCYPEPEEAAIPEFANWFRSCWKSPSSSPTYWDSPHVSPFSWDCDSIELTLKEDES